MSTVMKSAIACPAVYATPAVGAAAGPDRSVLAATDRATSGAATPPFDCMTRSVPPKPVSARRAASRSR